MKVSDTEVTFSWKDYSNNYAHKITTLKGEDFLGLFIRHILPFGFTRIRHYGFLSSASKKKSLALICKALGVKTPEKLTNEQRKLKALERMGFKPGRCKYCGGRMEVIEIIPNCFRQTSRAPPVVIVESINNLNRCITVI